jgi:hypothetical protein
VSDDIKAYIAERAAAEGISTAAWLRRLLIRHVHAAQQKERR